MSDNSGEPQSKKPEGTKHNRDRRMAGTKDRRERDTEMNRGCNDR